MFGRTPKAANAALRPGDTAYLTAVHGAQVVDRTVYASADGGANAALCYAWPDASVLRLP